MPRSIYDFLNNILRKNNLHLGTLNDTCTPTHKAPFPQPSNHRSRNVPHRQHRGEHNRQSVKQLVSLPGWYFSVYPARRPLILSGAPHSRVRVSKLGLMTFRKAGGPGTENKARAKVNNGDVAHKPFIG